MSDRYIVRILIAAPNTPYLIADKPPTTSLPGHMWYEVALNGAPPDSFGFAPIKSGQAVGPGKVYDNDSSSYQNPMFCRILEISDKSYAALLEFGNEPALKGFNLHYVHAVNNCVDFTWEALRQAKILNTLQLGVPRNFSGMPRPVDNIPLVMQMEPPIPNSPLNQVIRNPIPKPSSFAHHVLTTGETVHSRHEPNSYR